MRIVVLFISLFLAAGAVCAAAVTVSPEACTRVVRHVPTPDVAYAPGVDVDGDTVIPADVTGGIKVEPLSEVKIPITVDLQNRYGIPSNSDLFEAEAQIGTVTVAEGRVLFNGVPLVPADEAALVAACRAAAEAPE